MGGKGNKPESGMEKKFLSLLAFIWAVIQSCTSAPDSPQIRPKDRTMPEGTLRLLFEAIQRQEWDSLPTYCHPQIPNDFDTQLLCNGAQDSTSRAETLLFFGAAAVGDTFIEYGDTAMVPFTFGMSGSDKEEMHLIRKGGKWFLWKF